jgi:hypothetical protein
MGVALQTQDDDFARMPLYRFCKCGTRHRVVAYQGDQFLYASVLLVPPLDRKQVLFFNFHSLYQTGAAEHFVNILKGDGE